ncbi:ubiquitin-like protein [Rhizophagus irregularis DAOM 181602=DAOM 197198]|nr:ubiquitin-like protein [Rhizophagus irregularis DAOM 181602=DAOM 197198]
MKTLLLYILRSKISSVKQKISDKTNIDCKNKCLMFNNRQLIQEMKSLSDYEIKHEYTLHLRCGQCGC